MKIHCRVVFIFFVISFMLFINNVYALGISPPRVVFNFEPNMEETLKYYAINKGDKDMYIEISAYGELSEYLTLDKREGIIPAHGTLPFTAILKLPASLSKPGRHEANIVVLESIPPWMKKEGMITARIMIESQLWIEVPYPEKYIEIDIKATDVNIADAVEFIITASNLGSLDVIATGIIDIFDSNNNKIDTITTNSARVKYKNAAELHAKWETKGMKPGIYHAIAKVNYDGKIAEKGTHFKVGDLVVEIINITVPDIEEGSIGRFDILVQSFWTETISDVYAEIEVENTKIKSESISLNPWEKKIISIYWDTKGFNAGTYDIPVNLYYSDKITSKTVTVRIVKNLYMFLVLTVIIILIIVFSLGIYKKTRRMKKIKWRR